MTHKKHLFYLLSQTLILCAHWCWRLSPGNGVLDLQIELVSMFVQQFLDVGILFVV